MNTVLQDPATVGTLWKTMSARIRGAKTELKELGEEQDAYTQSTSKLQGLILKTTGFDIMKDKDTFKDIYDIIVGIGEAWPKLKDVEKASIGEALAGKRGANGLYAVLDNLDTLKSAYETAENSAGSAEREQKNYEKSIQYSFDRLSASAEEFATTFLNSGFVKGIADIGNAFLGVTTKINDFAGSLTTITPLLAGFLSMSKDVGIVQLLKGGKKTDLAQETLSVLPNMAIGSGGRPLITQEQMDYMRQYNTYLQKDVTVAKAFEMENGHILDNLEGVAAKAEDGSYKWQEYTTQTKSAALGTKILNAGLNMLGTALASLAISLIAKGFDYLANKGKYAGEALAKTADQFKEMQTASQKSHEWIDKNGEEFLKLSKGVDEFGHNISLTNEEYKSYISLSNEAGELFPGLIKNWDDLGNKIVDASDGLKSFNEEERKNNEANKAELRKKYYEDKDNFWEDDEANGISRSNEYAFLTQTESSKLGTFINFWNKPGLRFSGERAGKGTLPNLMYSEFIKTLTEEDSEIFKDFLSEIPENVDASEIQKLANEKAKYNSYYANLSQVVSQFLGLIEDTRKLYEQDIAVGADQDAQVAELKAKVEDENNQYYAKVKDEADRQMIDNIISSFDMLELKQISSARGYEDPYDWVNNEIVKPISEGLKENDFPSLYNQLFTMQQGDDEAYSAFVQRVNSIIEIIASLYNLKPEIIKKLLEGTEAGKATEGSSKINAAQKKFPGGEGPINHQLAEEARSWGTVNEKYIKDIESGKLQTKYGNVDMNDRPVITWDNKTRKKFKNEIKSWGENPKDFTNGSISTVFGADGTFGKKNEYEIAFTPIFKDKDGNAVLMGQDAVYDYIENIIDKAEEQIDKESKSGKFKNPQQQAQAVRDRILELDKKGLVAGINGYTGPGGQNIPSNQVGQVMHFAGNKGAKYSIIPQTGNTDQRFNRNPLGFMDNSQKEMNDYLATLTQEELNYINSDAVEAGLSIDQLKEKIKEFHQEGAESAISFKKAWKEVSSETKDKFKELAEAGNLTVEEFEKWDKAEEFLKKTGLSAEEATKKVNSLVDEIKQLATMEAGINNIQEVFKEKKEAKDKKPKEQSLDALGDKLEVSTWKGKDLKVWKDYKKLAIDGNTSTKKMKKAQNELATSYARTHNFLAGLNEENKEYYINSLKEIGIKNAAQVVNSELIAQEWDLREAKLGGLTATFDLSTATDAEIQQLAGEAAQLNITKGQLFDYIVEKTAANSHGILTGGDISNLENLRTALGLAIDDLIYYQKVKDWATNGSGTKYTKKGKEVYQGANGSATGVDYARRFGKVKTTTTSTPKRKKPKRDELKLGDFKGDTKNTGGGGGRGSGTDKSQKKTKEYIDWIERRITRISNIISKIGAQLENIGKWGSKFKKGKFLDLGTLSDSTDNKRVSKMQARYKDEIKYYQNLYKVQEIAEKKYNKKAKNYATGKTAKKLFGKKGIPSKIMKRIKNGDTTLLSSGWYQKLSSDQKSLVDQVIDFYDKGRNAKQAKEEAASSARQAKEASYQAAQEKFDTRIGRAEAKEAMAVGYERQNKFVKIQIDNMKKSYDQQIEIAKLEGNFAEAERLRYEAMQKEKELLVHELDNLAETYNLQRGINNRRIQDVDNLINVAKARGTRTTLSWYNDKNLNEERNIASYQDEILKYEALADKNFVQYGKDSPEYQNALEHIQELENNIAQSNQNIAENTSALHDAWNQAYDDMRANNKRSADNLNTVIGFDRGESIDSIHRGADSYYRFTQSGLAKFGGANASYVAASNSASLSLEQYDLMKKANDEYQKATTEEEKQKILQDASVNSYEDLVKREQGYYDKYLSDRKDMYDAEQKIIDLMTEYYESQKTYLSELIDAKKKILDEEKDLYDYERNINEKTKSISDIQKQLAAIRGDNSEEGKARQQRLQNQLDEAQKALDDEEYNRWKTDQESMLDNLQTQFDDIIDKHLKDQNELLKEGNALISQKGDAIQKAIGDIFTNTDIPLSEDLAEIKNALGEEGLGKVFTDLNSNISRWLEANGLGSTPTNSDGKDSENDIETYGSYDAKYKDSDTILKTKNKNANKKADKLRQYHDMDEMYKSDISLTQSQIDKIEKKKKKTAQDKKDLATYKKNLADLKKGKKNNLAEWNSYQKTIRDDASKEYDEAGTLEGMLFSVISNDSINSNTTKKSATSALNRVLLGTYGYSISEEALKALAEIFGFEADGSYSESGAAYQFFKTHKMAGFKTGGIGRLVKASGEDGIAMVRDGEGFVMPEHVAPMQNLLNITPQLDNIVNAVNKNGTGDVNNFGGFTFELPNVTDARSLINEFQNSKDMQKLLKISVEDLVSKGNYSNRIHSV